MPDDVATVQGALAAHVDTVFIRGGDRPETLLISAQVVLIAVPGDPDFEYPLLTQIQFYMQGDYASQPEILVRGLEFTRPVSFLSDAVRCQITLEDCYLRAGTTTFSDVPGLLYVTLRRCRLDGVVGLYSHGIYVVDSCVVTGEIRLHGADTQLIAMDNSFLGSGRGTAITSGDFEIAEATITGNIIERYGMGVLVEAMGSVHIEGNLIRDGAYHGVWLKASSGQILRNRVERCGGDGLVATAADLLVEENVIVQCAGSGMTVSTSAVTIKGNTVWGCGRHGIQLGDVYDDFAVRNNTLCLNAGAGISAAGGVQDGYRYEVSGNIAYANGGHGLEWGLGPPVPLRCNNWFGNTLGDVQGVPRAREDFSVDPQFCGAANGDFRLASTSQLLNPPGCGPVGALGVGCVGRSRLALLGPSPSRGPVRLEFELGEQAAIEIDVFDLQGRRVATLAQGTWPAGTHAVEWSGRAGSSRLPVGMYLVRYRYPGGEDRKRIILTP